MTSQALRLALLTTLFMGACSTSSKSGAPATGANDLSTACTTGGEGTWANGICTCNSGWQVDAVSGQCVVSATASTATVTSTATATSTAASAQAACRAAIGSGAVWNGAACICTNAALPTWDPTTLQCLATTGTTTTAVATATATATGIAVSPQQACVSSGGQLRGGNTCVCPVGTVFNVASFACTAYQAASGTQLFQNVCLASGGQIGSNQCLCPTGSATVLNRNAGVEFCSLSSASSGQGGFLQTILGQIL